jgi:hypothetical protein
MRNRKSKKYKQWNLEKEKVKTSKERSTKHYTWNQSWATQIIKRTGNELRVAFNIVAASLAARYNSNNVIERLAT